MYDYYNKVTAEAVAGILDILKYDRDFYTDNFDKFEAYVRKHRDELYEYVTEGVKNERYAIQCIEDNQELLAKATIGMYGEVPDGFISAGPLHWDETIRKYIVYTYLHEIAEEAYDHYISGWPI